MDVQINEKCTDQTGEIAFGNTKLMITPSIDETYWMFRVPVSESQAIVAFPKFGTIGVGFQVEEDWNTNLPYRCDASEIFDHISHNKGDDAIEDSMCIEAIEAIQAAVIAFKSAE